MMKKKKKKENIDVKMEPIVNVENFPEDYNPILSLLVNANKSAVVVAVLAVLGEMKSFHGKVKIVGKERPIWMLPRSLLREKKIRFQDIEMKLWMKK